MKDLTYEQRLERDTAAVAEKLAAAKAALEDLRLALSVPALDRAMDRRDVCNPEQVAAALLYKLGYDRMCQLRDRLARGDDADPWVMIAGEWLALEGYELRNSRPKL